MEKKQTLRQIIKSMLPDTTKSQRKYNFMDFLDREMVDHIKGLN